VRFRGGRAEVEPFGDLGLVLAGYAVALLAAASRTTIRRDVT
jgi:hypothetical protein